MKTSYVHHAPCMKEIVLLPVFFFSVVVFIAILTSAGPAVAASDESLGVNSTVFTEMWDYMEEPTNRTYLVAKAMSRGAGIVDTVFVVELEDGNFTFNWEINPKGWMWGAGAPPAGAARVSIDGEGAELIISSYLKHVGDVQELGEEEVPDHLSRVMSVLYAFSDAIYSGNLVPDDGSWSPPLLNLLIMANSVVDMVDERMKYNLNIFLDGQTDVLDLGILGRFDLATMAYTNLFLQGMMVLLMFVVSLMLLRKAHQNRRGL